MAPLCLAVNAVLWQYGPLYPWATIYDAIAGVISLESRFLSQLVGLLCFQLPFFATVGGFIASIVRTVASLFPIEYVAGGIAAIVLNAALATVQLSLFSVAPTVRSTTLRNTALLLHPARLAFALLHGVVAIVTAWMFYASLDVPLVDDRLVEAITVHGVVETSNPEPQSIEDLDAVHEYYHTLDANSLLLFFAAFLLGLVHTFLFFSRQQQQVTFPLLSQRRIFAIKASLGTSFFEALGVTFFVLLGVYLLFGLFGRTILSLLFSTRFVPRYLSMYSAAYVPLGHDGSVGVVLDHMTLSSPLLFLRTWLLVLTPIVTLWNLRQALFNIFLSQPLPFPLVAQDASERSQTILAGLAAARNPAPTPGGRPTNETGDGIGRATADNSRALLRLLAFQDLVRQLSQSDEAREVVYRAGQPSASLGSTSSGPTLIKRLVAECTLVLATLSSKLAATLPMSSNGANDDFDEFAAKVAALDEVPETAAAAAPAQPSLLLSTEEPFGLWALINSIITPRRWLRELWQGMSSQPAPRFLLAPVPPPRQVTSPFQLTRPPPAAQPQQPSESFFSKLRPSFLVGLAWARWYKFVNLLASSSWTAFARQEPQQLKVAVLFSELQLTLFAAEALSFIACHALDEDSVGGSREQIVPIVVSLLDLLNSVETQGRAALVRLQGSGASRQHPLAMSNCLKTCLYRITLAFGDSILQYDLPRTHSQRLQPFLEFRE
ncbi:hypothetical protein CAOG_005550 [Capsaspora owczarzaki ATCC 30864]|uniref:Nucleoporin NDC1 n=2 Tax=Capsaspora owczarzaki (strain ATCC 30864) TaxID=595528 RepID=A0A0D2WSE5_CAPO3|nr:hypothetical protein CAOG_005550 [Capsaspora owczarzaki ATCC 30864]